MVRKRPLEQTLQAPRRVREDPGSEASRLPLLREWLPQAARRGLARTALVAIAALRRDEAVELMLETIRDEPLPLAREALLALGSSFGDAPYERAKAATGGRRELAGALGRAFGRLG
jgi:hypothetical protein